MPTQQIDSWLSDLIKIGIPSLVAIVTAIIAYIQSRNANKLQYSIERMKIESVNSNALADKKRELCLKTAESIITIRNLINKYTMVFGACYNSRDQTGVYQSLLKEAQKEYSDFINFISKDKVGVIATARMIGSSNLDGKLLELFSVAIDTVANFGHTPQDQVSINDLIAKDKEVDDKANECLDMLMTAYNATTANANPKAK
jgi:hypothetical protein